ncbi:MAG: molybdopterin-dependent oxidoreductase [Anaerolineales bacterium]
MFKRFRVLMLALAMLALVGCQATPVVETVVVTATPDTSATAAPTPTPVIVVVTATPAPVTPTVDPAATLKIVGLSAEKVVSIDELKQMPATEGYAGTKSSTGKITPPAKFKGVSLLDLCNLVGGCDETTALSIVAKDGYAMTISYSQIVNGEFTTFDPATGDEEGDKGKLTPIVAYECEGKPIPSEEEGPLRLVIVSEEPNQITDGHWSVKWVREVQVKPAVTEWTLHLEGALVEEMSRDTFESGSAASCHGEPWVDSEGHEWVGIPLYYLVGRVDDGNKHEGGAFNDELVTKGYEIDVIAADGYTVTFDAARVSRNKDIILAYQMDGAPLPEDDWPLRLVGAAIEKNESIGAVAQIVLRGDAIVPITADTETPATATAETGTEKAAVAAPEMEAGILHVYGKVKTPIAFEAADLQQIGIVTVDVEHPKKGTITVKGVRLNEALAKCMPESAAQSAVFTAGDGYQIEVPLADVLACEDCIIELGAESYSLDMPGLDSGAWVKDVRLIEIK